MNNIHVLNNKGDILDAVGKNFRVGGGEELEPVAREQEVQNIYFILKISIDDTIWL